MSFTSQQTAMNRVVREIHAVDGLIAHAAEGAERPVFPHQDKRKRPVIWLEEVGFLWLRGQDVIEPVARGFILRPSVKRRLNQARDGLIGQHEVLETRELYSPDNVVRPVAVNTRSTALDRLARRPGQELNKRWLSPAEVEAGRALARDFHRAGEGQIGTQDFTSSGVQGGDRAGGAERAMLHRITTATRLRTAREILGTDLAPGVIALCCHDESLDVIERTERWAAGSGKQIIKLGLARLVTLYGTEAGVRSGGASAS
ncbi:hypothetical protein GCM10011309_00920 [Litorimonas cladophorae]|uniref:DUF6456 domain-containing protein n=1 Tax=Litorimonas cladophorae TaxID=1220491 RepID=A0A918NBP6_9PROT|nr:DUF6456 domain-containing protein [Litorimonas cladophorae]GGX56019.1 hypothetical protein GCM10011309_00920 [Litorimonas cladophorae]